MTMLAKVEEHLRKINFEYQQDEAGIILEVPGRIPVLTHPVLVWEELERIKASIYFPRFGGGDIAGVEQFCCELRARLVPAMGGFNSALGTFWLGRIISLDTLMDDLRGLAILGDALYPLFSRVGEDGVWDTNLILLAFYTRLPEGALQ